MTRSPWSESHSVDSDLDTSNPRDSSVRLGSSGLVEICEFFSYSPRLLSLNPRRLSLNPVPLSLNPRAGLHLLHIDFQLVHVPHSLDTYSISRSLESLLQFACIQLHICILSYLIILALVRVLISRYPESFQPLIDIQIHIMVTPISNPPLVQLFISRFPKSFQPLINIQIHRTMPPYPIIFPKLYRRIIATLYYINPSTLPIILPQPASVYSSSSNSLLPHPPP